MINVNDYPKVKAIIDSLPFGTKATDEMVAIVNEIASEYRNLVSFSHHDSSTINERVNRAIDKHLAKLQVLVNSEVLKNIAENEARQNESETRNKSMMEIRNQIDKLISEELMDIKRRCGITTLQNPFFDGWMDGIKKQLETKYYFGG